MEKGCKRHRRKVEDRLACLYIPTFMFYVLGFQVPRGLGYELVLRPVFLEGNP